jgi:hypothetical protein
VLKFAEDAKYKPFLLMLEHGIPLAAVWDKTLEAGLDPSHLLDDCEGPAIHQVVRDPDREENDALEKFVGRVDSEAEWRSHQTDWTDMKRSSVNMKDTPLIPRYAGIIQRQRVQRAAQATHSQMREQLAAEDHQSLVIAEDDMNLVTSTDRQTLSMKTNFPSVFSTLPVAYKSTRNTGIGVSTGFDVWGNGRKKVSYSETEFWRDVQKGGMRESVGTFGNAKGNGGFSLAVGSRVPITWKTEKEILETFEKKITAAP